MYFQYPPSGAGTGLSLIGSDWTFYTSSNTERILLGYPTDAVLAISVLSGSAGVALQPNTANDLSISAGDNAAGDGGILYLNAGAGTDACGGIEFNTPSGSTAGGGYLYFYIGAHTGGSAGGITLAMEDLSTNGLDGGNVIISAQNSSGTGTTGGAVNITAGSGTSANGQMQLKQQTYTILLTDDNIRMNNGNTRQELIQGTVSTTDATVTAGLAIPTVTNKSLLVEARIMCRRTGGVAGSAGDCASYILRARAKNISGTVTLHDNTVVYSSEDQAAWDAVLAVNGTNIEVQVTGAADNNIRWDISALVNGAF